MRPNFPALTVLRGLAAWWVVVYHFREQLDLSRLPMLQRVADHGYLAVDLFFIMSGFVIALNYADDLRHVSGVAVARFLGFRLARIYPLHLFILVVFLANPLAISLFSSAGTPGNRYAFAYYVQSLLLIQNWGFSPDLAWNVPAWSISTEWGAYLVFPSLALGLSHIVKPLPALAAVCGALLLTIGLGYGVGGLGESITSAGLLRCLVEFSLGAALYRLHASARHRFPPAIVAFLGGVGLLLVGMAARWPDYGYAPFALLLVITGLIETGGVAAHSLVQRMLLYVGEVSYSTYLVHFLMKDWTKFMLVGRGLPPAATFVAYIVATGMASAVLYHLVELPGRRSGRDWTKALLVTKRTV